MFNSFHVFGKKTIVACFTAILYCGKSSLATILVDRKKAQETLVRTFTQGNLYG